MEPSRVAVCRLLLHPVLVRQGGINCRHVSGDLQPPLLHSFFRAQGIGTADQQAVSGDKARERCHSAPPGQPQQQQHAARRSVLGALAAAPLLAAGRPAAAELQDFDSVVDLPSTSGAPPPLDTTFTDKVFLDIGLCPSAVRTGVDRKIGDASVLCGDPQPLGRIVIGLYGNLVPTTVANFRATLKAGAYTGTQFSRIRRGEYLAAGQQGSHRFGYVQPLVGLASNPDLVAASSFRLQHLRPGTVSLNLTENLDDEDTRLSPGYRNTSFLITTGEARGRAGPCCAGRTAAGRSVGLPERRAAPSQARAHPPRGRQLLAHLVRRCPILRIRYCAGPGPAPFLDGNVIFGQVLEGLDVVAAIAEVPTFRPLNDNIRAFNELGRLLGDSRASQTAAKWGKPLKAVVITAAGVL
eukprot:scaffold3.g6674.t1